MKKRELCTRLAVVAAAFCSVSPSPAQEPRRREVETRPGSAVEQLRRPTPTEAGGALKLLPDYQQKTDARPDGSVWARIWKKGGLDIMYVTGPRLGQVVNPKDKARYLKYWEQAAGARVVRFGFTNTKTLMISVPLDDKPGTLNAANFVTRADTPEAAADMVTMALSLIKADAGVKELTAPRKALEVRPK